MRPWRDISGPKNIHTDFKNFDTLSLTASHGQDESRVPPAARRRVPLSVNVCPSDRRMLASHWCLDAFALSGCYCLPVRLKTPFIYVFALCRGGLEVRGLIVETYHLKGLSHLYVHPSVGDKNPVSAPLFFIPCLEPVFDSQT